MICVLRLDSRLSLLRRINPYLTPGGSFHLYNACIHSHLLYCSSAWGNCSLTPLLRLLRVQKCAARVILNADFSTPSITLFSKLKWIPICDLVKWEILQLLFSIILNPDSPFRLKADFSFLSGSRSTAITRGFTSHSLEVPRLRTNSGKRTFAYSTSVPFNTLDAALKQRLACP